jgi:hypothetical protein
MIKHNHQDQESRLTPHFRSFWPVSTHSSRGRPRPAPPHQYPWRNWAFRAAAHPTRRLPTRLGSTRTGLAHRTSWWPSPPRRSRFVLTGRALHVPHVGRAGAANHPRPAVTSGQPRTTTPQVNPPVRWYPDRPDLAYNDEVTRAAAPPSRLAYEALVTAGGPHRAVEPEPSPLGASVVVLVGRAIRVPEAAGTSGMQRSATVTQRRPLDRAPTPDLGWKRRPKLHGMQGVIAGSVAFAGEPCVR